MRSGSKKLAAWVRAQIGTGTRKQNVGHRVRRVSKTGWIKAKAVRVVRKGGRSVVQVKR